MKLKVLADGPILIESKGKAKITQFGVEKPIEGSMVALCRCGQSKNKPFCDGSHSKANFKADAAEIDI
ncbi:MAG: CDGSH iron-sulfur domain-containing protein [Candidatus Bathyarchaeia archaeon]|jgi:CDGSH-type Zn-finger protein